MVMTTFEYNALLEKIKRKENKKKKKKEKTSTFHTWKEPGIIYDEYGAPHLGIVEKTGFEGEGA